MRLNMRIISPVLQITIGLLLLTLSILLIGDLLGFVPNQKQSMIEARKTMAESLAIQITFEVGEGRTQKAAEMLDVIVKRNPHILSIGLRSNTKEMVMSSEDHASYWSESEEERSTAEHVQVPIFGEEGRWGTLELTFTPLDSLWDELFSGRSFAAMMLFVLISGAVAYWLFLKRVLSELDPSSVVPERVRSALDVLTEGLVILDTSERIVLINASLEDKLGVSEETLVGKHLSTLSWEMDEEGSVSSEQRFPWTFLFETNEIPAPAYLRLKTAEHGTLTFNVNISPIKSPDQKLKGAIVTIDDITEIEKKNKELAQVLERLEKSQEEISRQNIELIELATRDPLTGLLNRRSLFEGMNNLLREMRAQDDVMSCMMLDIDFFKSVNDNLGHAAGDVVIQVFAEIIQATVRSNDLVGRYGGEEFVVALPGLDETQAEEIAERIRVTVMQRRFDELAEGFSITSSFGIASTLDEVWQSDKLVDHADQALYVAKMSGRNRVVCYTKKGVDQTDGPNPLIEESNRQHEIKAKPVTSQEHTDATEKKLPEITSAEVGLIESSGAIPLKVFDMMGESARIVIFDRLTQALNQAHRNQTKLAVLTIYIDTIQTIKSTLGYSSAEKLRKVAFERISETLRSSDSVMPETNMQKSVSLSHSKDSEFTAVLSGIEEALTTTRAIQRLVNDLAAPVDIDGNEIVMTVNIGASIYPSDGEHPEELLTNSAMALQNAIKEGRGAALFYSQEMNRLSKEGLRLESQLHQAIEREEFYLDFQPILNIKKGRVEKFEALIRWRHPELGLVPPDHFIQIAERVGLIKPIGAWVLKTACQRLRTWQRSGHPYLKVSVNLSAVQFEHPDLAEEIFEIVETSGVSADSVIFELTETALLKRLDNVIDIILRLHDAGFQIALDDFGTGYSSLDYLRKLPIDLVKIDRSYMSRFPDDMHDVSIVNSLIGLSHDLGIGVIAEGMEHEAQMVTLRDLGCDEVQGYLLSRPLAVEDVAEFLDSTDTRRLMRRVEMTAKSPAPHREQSPLADVLNIPPGS